MRDIVGIKVLQGVVVGLRTESFRPMLGTLKAWSTQADNSLSVSKDEITLYLDLGCECQFNLKFIHYSGRKGETFETLLPEVSLERRGCFRYQAQFGSVGPHYTKNPECQVTEENLKHLQGLVNRIHAVVETCGLFYRQEAAHPGTDENCDRCPHQLSCLTMRS